MPLVKETISTETRYFPMLYSTQKYNDIGIHRCTNII